MFNDRCITRMKETYLQTYLCLDGETTATHLGASGASASGASASPAALVAQRIFRNKDAPHHDKCVAAAIQVRRQLTCQGRPWAVHGSVSGASRHTVTR